MVFQSYAFESSAYNPINMGHASFAPLAGAGNKKRKALDELDSYDAAGEVAVRPKLSLPRSAGLVFNGDAQFHPLPPHVNQEMLAQLGHSPFASTTSNFVTPSSSSGSLGSLYSVHEHKSTTGSDYFTSTASSHYPEVEPYPSTSPSSSYGILGPAPGRSGSISDPDGMDVDDRSCPNAPVHGPQCKSIPQLCVRYNDGAGSELWATCPDCGACSKVDSSRPSSNLCYSP